MMKNSDMRAFFVNQGQIDPEKYIRVEYTFESLTQPDLVAAHLCQEMSTAQWKRVDVDEDFRPDFAAKVIALESEEINQPSCPSLAKTTLPDYQQVFRVNVIIAYPYQNFGTKIPNLLTVLCGEGVFHAPFISSIRLMDIHFPDNFLADFQGPQFGISGLRDMLDIYDRPILLGVIKPNVGLPPIPFAELAYQAWLGGLDIAKEDEQMSDAAWSSLADRSKLLGEKRALAEKETGQKKIYLANVTDEINRILPLHDIAVKNGANAVMLNSMTTGISAMRMLRKHSRVPITSHFDLFGAMTQIPFHGVREVVFTKIQRLAGMDIMVYPGFSGRLKTTEEDILASVQACTEQMGNLKTTLPVPAGSQWAGSLETLYNKLQSIDFGIVPGRGVFNHPMGPKGGAVSLRQGWDAVKSGTPIVEYAQGHRELQLAVEMHRS